MGTVAYRMGGKKLVPRLLSDTAIAAIILLITAVLVIVLIIR